MRNNFPTDAFAEKHLFYISLSQTQAAMDLAQARNAGEGFCFKDLFLPTSAGEPSMHNAKLPLSPVLLQERADESARKRK